MARTRWGVLVSTALVVLTLAAPASATTGTSGRTVRGVVYAVRAGEPLRLDAYLPSHRGPRPGVILLHGGSWSGGSRADLARIGEAFAAEGFAAFSIDYRLAPAHPYPAALEDAQAAVRWVRRNASRFGVAGRRMAAFGVSAGGHLAAMLAVAGQGSLERGSRVRAAASWSGPMDLASLAGDAPLHEGAWLGYHVDRFVGCSHTECPERVRDASPATHVDPSDGAVLLASSTHELVGFRQAEQMDRALARQAVPHRVVEVEGSRHASFFESEDVRSLQTGWAATITFLRTWTSTPRSVAATAPVRFAPDPVRTAGGLALFFASAVVLAVSPSWGRGLRARRRMRRLLIPGLDPAMIALAEDLGRDGADRRGIESTLVSAA